MTKNRDSSRVESLTRVTLSLLPTVIRRSVGTCARLIGSTFVFSQMNPSRDCHLRTHQILRGHTRNFVRACILRANKVSQVATGKLCAMLDKECGTHYPSSETQWGLILIKPLCPYYLGSGRRSRSDGRKL